MTDSAILPSVPTLLGTTPFAAPLKNGVLRPTLFNFAFADIAVAQNGFKALVRDGAFDVAECAIVTVLQAKAYGKPLVLLPFIVNGTFHHASVVYHSDIGDLTPKGLEGRRVGIRSYTQTTPTWIRGFLANDEGVDLDRVRWVTFEDSHLEEFSDPPGVERAAPGKKLADMLLSGEVDAAFMGRERPEGAGLRELYRDPQAAAAQWYAKHRVVPINHMLVVSERLAKSRPDIVRQTFELFVAARRMQPPGKRPDGVDLAPIGLGNIRPALELVIDYALQQKLIPRRLTVDELFDQTTATLGAS
jgi:4,5-dihydroxyphthalate decarboxylase